MFIFVFRGDGNDDLVRKADDALAASADGLVGGADPVGTACAFDKRAPVTDDEAIITAVGEDLHLGVPIQGVLSVGLAVDRDRDGIPMISEDQKTSTDQDEREDERGDEDHVVFYFFRWHGSAPFLLKFMMGGLPLP